MFNDGWNESETVYTKGFAEIPMDLWDLDAMLILMNIVHGCALEVPRKVELSTLTHIAEIANFYSCQRPVHVMMNNWIDCLSPREEIPVGDAVNWIFIARVFREPDLFYAATKVALTESQGRIYSSLPMPSIIISTYYLSFYSLESQITRSADQLNIRCEKKLRQLISEIKDLYDTLTAEENNCCSECISLQLGALIKGLKIAGLEFPFPDEPYEGFSLEFVDGLLRRSKAHREMAPSGIVAENVKYGMTVIC
ncbi:uncharacterized protein ACLA_044120 [Aspergillus clavatus NRRL 1]|uniref:BTB domain-containing protein n=1 Tax=Aspergillus clavatus (strain ATCC 1007 / CBS 513.65 / DSM 816 / NCTC 3887 / NRRL 1 / QM 1276 / 107) TaxID=344612 RepID=A1C8Q5_ASPCL|nr:uncharacterized protein ACLA_044120 [Aspergillus clavatus NRRL 1]EAW13692.1 hypothetical protein ACLA_044120 [Aspergillus clavatus NRRL 1]